jgi:hypothetical protein
MLNGDQQQQQPHFAGGGSYLRGISIVMQLDAVHQNVVRYKLLMEVGGLRGDQSMNLHSIQQHF